ncbi:Uncharacterized protein Rs2_35664 [Raphanus sativus]|nr:Uncharacterized protein Rs2_35664 [Raphanus sativus]
MAELSESEKRANSSSSRSSSPPSRHGKDVQNPLTPAPLSFVSSGFPQVGPVQRLERMSCAIGKKSICFLLPLSFAFPDYRSVLPVVCPRRLLFMKLSLNLASEVTWRILIAIQNLGDEEGLAFGVNEILFAYHLAPINGHEGCFHLRPRSGLPIVEELPKTDRKRLDFVKKWPERYVFMTLPGSHYRWNFVEGTHSAPVEGECNVLQARKLPLEQRRVTHLLSPEVLHRSKLWEDKTEGSPEDPMVAFKKAMDAISARRDSSSRNASGDGATTSGNKRRMIRRSSDSSPSRVGRPREGVSTRSQRLSLTGFLFEGLSDVLSDLKANLFAWMQALPLDKDSPGIIQQVQSELLQGSSMNRDEVLELSRQLSEENSRHVAKELELRYLQAKIRAIEGSVEIASAESLQLSREKQELEETIVELRTEAETSKNMTTMAVNSARIVARWEVEREWLKGQAQKLNLHKEYSQYKIVVLAEAEFKGIFEPPSFEDEPAIPSSRCGSGPAWSVLAKTMFFVCFSGPLNFDGFIAE